MVIIFEVSWPDGHVSREGSGGVHGSGHLGLVLSFFLFVGDLQGFSLLLQRGFVAVRQRLYLLEHMRAHSRKNTHKDTPGLGRVGIYDKG